MIHCICYFMLFYQMFLLGEPAVTKVCGNAIKKILGVSNFKWNRVKRNIEVTRSARDRLSYKEEIIFKFLTKIQKYYAENIPNSEKGLCDLPTNFTVQELMKDMHRELADAGISKTISYSYFMKTWQV